MTRQIKFRGKKTHDNLELLNQKKMSETEKIDVDRLYSLRPLEQIKFNGKDITRVPGGWIFESTDNRDNWRPVFVPFNNEWQDLNSNCSAENLKKEEPETSYNDNDLPF